MAGRLHRGGFAKRTRQLLTRVRDLVDDLQLTSMPSKVAFVTPVSWGAGMPTRIRKKEVKMSDVVGSESYAISEATYSQGNLV